MIGYENSASAAVSDKYCFKFVCQLFVIFGSNKDIG